MGHWQSATLVTEGFPHWAKPATLDVDPRGGSVEIARRDSNGDWQSFEEIDSMGSFKVEVVNSPELRISTSSGAMFRWTWNG